MEVSEVTQVSGRPPPLCRDKTDAGEPTSPEAEYACGHVPAHLVSSDPRGPHVVSTVRLNLVLSGQSSNTLSESAYQSELTAATV